MGEAVSPGVWTLEVSAWSLNLSYLLVVRLPSQGVPSQYSLESYTRFEFNNYTFPGPLLPLRFTQSPSHRLFYLPESSTFPDFSSGNTLETPTNRVEPVPYGLLVEVFPGCFDKNPNPNSLRKQQTK